MAPQESFRELLSWDDALPFGHNLSPSEDFYYELKLVIPAREFLNRLSGFPGLSPAERRAMLVWGSIFERARQTVGELFFQRHALGYPEQYMPLMKHLQKLGYLTTIGVQVLFTDVPRQFHYIAKFSLEGKTDGDVPDEQLGSASAGSAESAFLGAIGEALERQIFCTYRSREFRWSRESDLRDAVSLAQFNYFTNEQLAQPWFEPFRKKPGERFAWLRVEDLLRERPVWIPAQCVFWNYHFREEEQTLFVPTTNGEAVGTTLEGAYAAAILELIERDAFLIFWLRCLVPSRVDLQALENDPSTPHSLAELFRQLKRYKIKVTCLDCTSDFGVPVIVAVLQDPAGIGAAVSVGAKADFNPLRAVEGALYEALRIFSGVRVMRYQGVEPPPLTKARAFESDLDRDGRIGLWGRKEMAPHIEWFLGGELHPLRKVPRQWLSFTDKDKFDFFQEIFRKKRYSLYGADRTPKELAALGFYTVKAIAPQTVPLYLLELWPYLACERLRSVPASLGFNVTDDQWNDLAHPFP